MNIDVAHANPNEPPITTTDRWQSLLPANSKPLEHALASLSAKFEPIPVPFANIWDVDKCPDNVLPFLAYAWSVDEWNDNWSAETQREVIRQSIWVHQRKGTLGAVKRALEAMGYDSDVIEWWQKTPRGRPGTFSIEVHPTKKIITDSLNQIRAVIDAVKRKSAHYDIFLGLTVQAPVCAYAVAVIGVEIEISN